MPKRSASAPVHQPGDMIGRYKVLELLGEGGFGVVYLAEQTEPVWRRVALKVIKPGMDSKAVVARFEAERQALAMMSHPNIAKVLDAGTMPLDTLGSGRPYFVMEHIKGTPITDYCDTHRLTVEQRLRLFAVACEAVQHAHMKGIIHRDLKPSNILVTITEGAEPRPVVIDFGVAKALAGRLTEQTIYTAQGMLIGTPEYMSPEQAEMAETDIDTRSDVYSLGVILYELLTGAVPFDATTLRAAGVAAIRKLIREADPPRPSTKLSTVGEANTAIAAARHMALGDLAAQLRRELEWIPLKALRKDRAERYRSASELADDVGNYLAHRPLIAGPESVGYKARKFVRRNKGAVAAAGVIAASLVLATGVSVWFGLRASAAQLREHEQRVIAELARTRAEAINAFVTRALQSSDPMKGGKQDTTIADAMQNAIREIESGAFRDDPRTEAGLKCIIALIFKHNGGETAAEPLLVQALETYQRLYKGDHVDVATSLDDLASVRLLLGRTEEAEPLFLQALEMRQRLFKGDNPDVAMSLNNVAVVRHSLGRAAEAEPLMVRALEMCQRFFKGDNQDVANNLGNLATIRRALGRYPEAEALYAQSLEMHQRLHRAAGGIHPDVANALSNLATIRGALGRDTEAEPLLAQALEMYQRLYKGDHSIVARGLINLGAARRALGRSTEAESLMVQALEMNERLHTGTGSDHPDVAGNLSNLAFTLNALHRQTEAEPLLRRSLEMRQRLYGGDHPDVAQSLFDLGDVRAAQSHEADAEPLFLQCLEMRRRLFKGDHPDLILSLNSLAAVRCALGKFAEARPLFDESVVMLRRQSPQNSPVLCRVLWRSGRAHLDSGDSTKALPQLEEALAMGEKLLPFDHPRLQEYRETLAKCRTALAK